MVDPGSLPPGGGGSEWGGREAAGTTFAARVVEYATAFDYASLPAEIVDWSKGVLLDTLGCAIAGFDSPPSQISRAVLAEMGGTPESTIIGSDDRLPCTAAAFANGTMVRYQDLNDTYLRAHAIGHSARSSPRCSRWESGPARPARTSSRRWCAR